MLLKLVKAGVGLAAVAFAAAYFGSPVWATHKLTQAVEARDAEAIRRYVDFPAFRASLKDEMSAHVLRRIDAETGLGDELGGLGRMLAPGLVSGLVDLAVTPETVAAIVETGEAPGTSLPGRRPDAEAADKPEVKRSWSYRGLNLFAVTLSRADAPDDRLALLMERRGLFDWKLAGVDLDPGADGP